MILRNKMSKVNHKLFSEIISSFADSKRIYVTEDKTGNMTIIIKSNICRLEIITGNLGIHVIAQADVDVDINTGYKRRLSNEYQYIFTSDFGKVKLKKYKELTEKLFRYLIGEALCMPYTSTHRASAVPMDVLQSEIKDYTKEYFWENYFIAAHDYNKTDELEEWLERCCSEHRVNCRKVREDAKVMEESYVFFRSDAPETFYPGICLVPCRECKNPCIIDEN